MHIAPVTCFRKDFIHLEQEEISEFKSFLTLRKFLKQHAISCDLSVKKQIGFF